MFEVSGSSTVVTAIGSDKKTMYHLDLTHTNAEDKFIELLKVMNAMEADVGERMPMN